MDGMRRRARFDESEAVLARQIDAAASDHAAVCPRESKLLQFIAVDFCILQPYHLAQSKAIESSPQLVKDEAMMSSPPTGTVTFLFTDIEGSTRLAQQYPAAWPSAKVRHHTILQSAIESHSGYIFQRIGDAFCAAFHTAPDAFAAALDAQRVLHAEPWGDAVIGVRMGIHTGAATVQQDGDYEGYMTVVRVQRIMSAAYGGQVLMSQEVCDLLHRDLPAGITVRDRGTHRLKDLTAPEHLHQLVAPDLPINFPPLKTADHPNNLPRQLTSFIGREAEIVELRQLLSGSPLLTLTGAGGVGKTRLVLQVASEELTAFPDGVWFVELAPLADPALIPTAIASAAGVREVSGRPILTTLSEYFHEKTALEGLMLGT